MLDCASCEQYVRYALPRCPVRYCAAALPGYSSHPAHLAVVEQMAPHNEGKLAFDYVVE